MRHVLIQLKYHLGKFNDIRNRSRYFNIHNPYTARYRDANPYAGYTIEMFYKFLLQKKTIDWVHPLIAHSSASSERQEPKPRTIEIEPPLLFFFKKTLY